MVLKNKKKAAINLVGVSYSTSGRVRNFNQSFESLKKNIETPIIDMGYDVDYFLTTYDNEKNQEILDLYNPIDSTFLDSKYSRLGGGDKVSMYGKNMLVMVYAYLTSLEQLKKQETKTTQHGLESCHLCSCPSMCVCLYASMSVCVWMCMCMCMHEGERETNKQERAPKERKKH